MLIRKMLRQHKISWKTAVYTDQRGKLTSAVIIELDFLELTGALLYLTGSI